MKVNVKAWLKDAGIRAWKISVQTAATIGMTMFLSGASWKFVAEVSLLSGILSLFSSIAELLESKNKDLDNRK